MYAQGGMMAMMPRLLCPPQWADEEKTRVARLLHIIAAGVFIGCMVPVIQCVAAKYSETAITLALTQICAIATMWLNYRGLVKRAVYVMILGLIATATVLIWNDPYGFRNEALLIYPPTIVMAALLLDWRSYVFISVTAILCVGTTVLAEMIGVHKDATRPATHLISLTNVLILMSMTCIVVGVLAKYLRDSLARARRHEGELEASNRELEQQAQRLKAFYEEIHDLYNNAPCGYHSLDAEGTIVRINDTELSWLGYSRDEIEKRKKFSEIITPESRVRFVATFEGLKKGGVIKDVEYEMICKNGSVLPVLFNASAVRNESGEFVMSRGSTVDIADKKNAESRMLRSQRLESIGRLAGGMAHDLNNILTPILLSAPLLRDEPLSESACSTVDAIETCAKRGANIIRQVLTFSRGFEGRREPLALDHLLREMAVFIVETFPKSISLKTHFPNTLWRTVGNATQIYQVLMNLCVNARDAMPQGGELTLAGENIQVSEPLTGVVGHAGPGAYVLLTIEDTGTGIAPEHLDHVFDPFYTTKPMDKGTGLGLATVLGIVQGHAGVIQLHSKVGDGTRFKIYLPATSSVE